MRLAGPVISRRAVVRHTLPPDNKYGSRTIPSYPRTGTHRLPMGGPRQGYACASYTHHACKASISVVVVSTYRRAAR